jgi:hypothetical protein
MWIIEQYLNLIILNQQSNRREKNRSGLNSKLFFEKLYLLLIKLIYFHSIFVLFIHSFIDDLILKFKFTKKKKNESFRISFFLI